MTGRHFEMRYYVSIEKSQLSLDFSHSFQSVRNDKKIYFEKIRGIRLGQKYSNYRPVIPAYAGIH